MTFIEIGSHSNGHHIAVSNDTHLGLNIRTHVCYITSQGMEDYTTDMFQNVSGLVGRTNSNVDTQSLLNRYWVFLTDLGEQR